jgi:hypothetical protein
MSARASFQKKAPSAFGAGPSDDPPSSRRPRSLFPPGSHRQPPGNPLLASGRPLGSALQSLVVQRNDGEIILDYPKTLEPVTSVRSTLITSSLTSLRARGLFERYDALQTSPHRQKILNLVAGEWLPVEIAFAHYQACDALGLSVEEQVAIGKDVSRRIHDTFLSLVVKAARGVGVTPWLLLPQGNKMQGRLCIGGGLRVCKLGPKSVRIELVRLPHLVIPYVRHGLLGLYTAAVELLASNVTARIVKSESADPARLFVLRIDWE